MPKLKTHRGAAKRFKPIGNTFKHRCTNRSHINTDMSSKRKRHLRSDNYVSKAERKRLNHSLVNLC